MSEATKQDTSREPEDDSGQTAEYSNILSKIGIPAEPRDLSIKERTLLAAALFGAFFGLPLLGILIFRMAGA